jgi:hypothetical protein
MVQITLDNLVPASIPADGWIVQYRIKGSSDPFTTAVGSPFNAFPIVFSTIDPAGTLYEGKIICDCGAIESTEFLWETPCDCTDVDYDPNTGGTACEKLESQAPTITSPGYCLAPSTNGAYSAYESRIYTSAFVNADILLPPGTVGGNIFASMVLAGQWANPALSSAIGPMNREGIWIDSDCNGSKDPLGIGLSVTIATLYNNTTGSPKTIHVGMGADNRFRLIVNGTELADSVNLASSIPFMIWHIFPVVVQPGINYINMVSTGDGSINDAMAMVVYDNTAIQIQGATDDSQLNIVFASHSLRGNTYDIATCPSGWTLDTSGGTGNFVCRRTLTMSCNTAP